MAVLRHGVTLEPGRGSFDLVVRLSTLRPRERITIPTRQTRVLNTWLSRPGARLVQGCALSEKAIVVWVEFPEPQARESGDVIGIDVGISKLIATSEAQAIGTQWRQISARVRRRRPGSLTPARNAKRMWGTSKGRKSPCGAFFPLTSKSSYKEV
jgi:transposase